MNKQVQPQVGDKVKVLYLGTEMKGRVLGFRLFEEDDLGAPSVKVQLYTARGSIVYIPAANIRAVY